MSRGVPWSFWDKKTKSKLKFRTETLRCHWNIFFKYPCMGCRLTRYEGILKKNSVSKGFSAKNWTCFVDNPDMLNGPELTFTDAGHTGIYFCLNIDVSWSSLYIDIVSSVYKTFEMSKCQVISVSLNMYLWQLPGYHLTVLGCGAISLLSSYQTALSRVCKHPVGFL